MGDATKLAFAVFLISCSSGGCGGRLAASPFRQLCWMRVVAFAEPCVKMHRNVCVDVLAGDVCSELKMGSGLLKGSLRDLQGAC